MLPSPSPPFSVIMWGKLASFTRYDTPAEAQTYPMLTVPAAEGVLTSLYWHPGFSYEILSIAVLKPVVLLTRSGNELRVKNTTNPVYGNRTQRMRQYIHSPEYLVTARQVPWPEATACEAEKYESIFRKRLERGAYWQPPYFGLRELACSVRPADGSETPWNADADLGPMPLYLEEREQRGGPLVLTRHEREQGHWKAVQYPGFVTAHYMQGRVRGGVLRVPPYRGTT